MENPADSLLVSFNSKTEIRFQVPRAGYVSLIIINSAGRQVRKLLGDFLPQGSYRIPFYADIYAGGHYYYLLRINQKRTYGKMCLIK